MLDSNRVALTLTVDQLLNARMLAAPETIKVNGATDCYLTNACNDSLSVVRVESHAINHWVGVAPRATLEETDWAIYGRTLTPEEVGGAVADQDATLFAAPFWVPLPPSRPWIEGLASQQNIQQEIEQHYGVAARQFLQLAVLTAERTDAVRAIFDRLNVDLDVLMEALGEHFGVLDFHFGPPTLSMMPLSASIAPDHFTSRRNRLGPYITVGANGDETADDAPAQGGLSLEGIGNEIATALASKEDRRQIEQLSSGDVNNRGVLMAGAYNKKTGDIETLAFAEATEALKLAQKKTTVGERAFCIKRILDTNNKKRPPNSTRALFRNMGNHDIVFATAITKGLWATQARETMDGMHTEASIFALIPLFKV